MLAVLLGAQSTSYAAEVNVLLICVAALAFCRCLARFLLASGAFCIFITPRSLHKLGLVQQRQLRKAFCYAVASLILLGTVQFIVVTVRLVPDLLPFLDGFSLQARLLEAFPADLQVQVVNGVLTTSNSSSLQIELSQHLLNICGGPLKTAVESLDFGVADLRMLGEFFLVIRTFLFDEQDPFVRVSEFQVGEEVEAQVSTELIRCGVSRSLRPPPLSSLWMPVVIQAVHPSTQVADFRYLVRSVHPGEFAAADAPGEELLSADAEAECAGDADFYAGRCSCSLGPMALRRQPRLAVLPQGERVLKDADLQAYRSVFVFEESRFAILHGYSFHHGQHWQFRSAGKTGRSRLWHEYSLDELHLHSPLSFLVSWFCRSNGDAEDLLCSRAVAQGHFADFLEHWPFLAAFVRLRLHIPALLFCLWLLCVLATVVVRFVMLLMIYFPAGFVVYGLFRHVDTSRLPMLRVLAIVLFSAIPYLMLRRLAIMVWQVWGEDVHLNPLLQDVLKWEVSGQGGLLGIWLLCSSYAVIRMRELAVHEEHQQQLANLRSLKLPEEAPSSEMPGDDSQPSCRICFGGSECGPLISPCLCRGSVRYVHADCLNTWRTSSANPESSYASILRSSFVLHVLTTAAFASAVVLASLASLYIDKYLNKGDWGHILNSDLVERLANHTDLDLGDEDKTELLKLLRQFNNYAWGDVKLVHIASGTLMMGLLGSASMGLFLYPFLNPFLSGADPFASPMIILLVLIGVVRIFYLIFALFKRFSGKVLQSAESVILDVGAPVRSSAGAEAVGEAPQSSREEGHDVAEHVTGEAPQSSREEGHDVAEHVTGEAPQSSREEGHDVAEHVAGEAPHSSEAPHFSREEGDDVAGHVAGEALHSSREGGHEVAGHGLGEALHSSRDDGHDVGGHDLGEAPHSSGSDGHDVARHVAGFT
eukprot:TRINITY_DN11309_c0_g1_i4.p1 TRINITY_DN11309_c0_g1~~TRINITY_DN11309_c0_g1_i4.p1  ORF type:complete len:950 (+),score=176.06 TRINITY_DN11309_c0_g1_i4:58-2850(+)